MGLGERLVEKGAINAAQLEQALQESRKTGLPIKQILLRLKLVNEETIGQLQAEELGVPFVDLSDYIIDQETLKLIPETVARKHMLIPLFKIGNSVTVAMANPADVVAIDEARLRTRHEIETVVATSQAIEKAIHQYYGVTQSVEDIVKSIDLGVKVNLEEADAQTLSRVAEEAPIIRLVNLLLTQAVREGASDIHIEPEENVLMIRLRVDGTLHAIEPPPKRLQSAIISRIKVISGMDIGERRKPQDGRIKIRIEGKEIDIRVSTFPTMYGENVVLRLLEQERILLGLDRLGFTPEILTQYQRLMTHPNGIILVTGPTGSGKTTTLYNTLNALDRETKNILTIEDPVEYHLNGIRQSQINLKAGLTFASGLRSLLRQDPDIIMVGEIRDTETAEVAIQAALTGHLVLSTLHTNSATGTLTRLLDMGIEPFLISSSVIGILAQRLVRRICEKCKEPFQPPADLLERLKIPVAQESRFFHGKGCRQCRSCGYSGRVAIFELLILEEQIRGQLMNRESAQKIQTLAQQAGMRTLREDGLRKAASGITTLEEVLNVTQET
ncbi:MAG: type II secretion system ATPase GspE [Candidatus Omnitrophica bacterium]|nr:type II secretion system ATPase GspE [Candidatus Omnitrophota bacterium]